MGQFTAGLSLREQLRILEDKRLAFAARARGEGFDPEASLYIQREGGFWGLAVNGEERCVLYGPGPGEDADFRVDRYPRGALTVGILPAAVESTGLGGAFGFGQKGGEGFTIVVLVPEGRRIEMTLISGVGAYLETNRIGNGLLSLKRAHGDANFVWRLHPGGRAEVRDVCEGWRDRMAR
jgi:hypothetical protein